MQNYSHSLGAWLPALVLTLVLSACNSSGGGGVPDSDEGSSDDSFVVEVTVSGLNGNALIVSLNEEETLTIDSDGSFGFTTELDDGASYSVSAQVLPEEPAQNCDFENAEGIIDGSDATDITISCHAAVKMLGRVAGPVISGATVQASVGAEEYQTTTDEQGMYELRLSVRDPDDMVALMATDPTDGFVLYRSYLGNMARVRDLATEHGLLTREQAVSVNITNISTANAALMRWRNAGQAPQTEAERMELAESYSANLMLRSSALILIAMEDPDRLVAPAVAGSLLAAGLATTEAEDTSSLIENEGTRDSYEQEVEAEDPEMINNTISEILADQDLVEGINEDEVPDSWFGISSPEPNSITGTYYDFSADGTGIYANHVDSVTFTWEIIDNNIDITLDEPLTTGGFCFVEDGDGSEYQTACVTELEDFNATLVAEENGVDLVSVDQAGTRSYPDEPGREAHAVENRSDIHAYSKADVELLDEADIADSTWSMPGNFPALVGGLPWYGSELLNFVSGGTGNASESGAFNWSFNDDGWLVIEYGSGAVHEVALLEEQYAPVWRTRFLSSNDQGDPRSYRGMIAPQNDAGGLDAAFASELFVQWGYETNDELAFAIDLREDGWGGPRNVEKATDDIWDIWYEFDYRFDSGELIMETWAQPMDNGEEWWGRQSICDGTQTEDCYLTMRRSWTLLDDDGEWVSLLERIENLDANGELISYSPRTIQYRRY